MMDYIAENGQAVTDEMFDAMAKEYEDGTWAGEFGKVIAGRPRLSGEETVTLTVKVPKSRMALIDTMAKKSGASKSAFVRDAIDKALFASLAG
jgi:hypothetical protein